MNNIHNNQAPRDDERTLDEALNRSDRELIHLANFYHQRGYISYAQEIYRSLFKIRAERDDLCAETSETRDYEAS